MQISALEREIELSSRIIKAAEKWSPEYKKDRDSLKLLIAIESRIETIMFRYFKTIADRVDRRIDWYAYNRRLYEISAAEDNFDVEVLITETDDELDAQEFMSVMFEPIKKATKLGFDAAEKSYKVPVISETSIEVERAAKERVAYLVGKRVTNDGQIIDNPRAKYRITDDTRRRIKESLATSLNMRENQEQTIKRMQQVIKNPKRAELIAQTEAVNAYQDGVFTYAKTSGAVGKEWETVGANDICATYARLGAVELDYVYNSTGLKKPAAHPRCRCSLRIIYPEDPAAKKVIQRSIQTEGEPITVGYHGNGHNMSNGNYSFGDAYYIARDPTVASNFGKVRAIRIDLSASDILRIVSDQAYQQLIMTALRNYPGVNINISIPKTVIDLGFKAVEMSPDLDPLAGIAIVDLKLLKQIGFKSE